MESWQEIDKYFILFAGTAGMLVLCGGMLLFFRGYHHRLMAQQDERNRMELQYRDELMLANLKATEKERARIAAELHDEVGASLALLRLQAKGMQADTESIIDSTIDNVRRISYGLSPPTLKAFGIVAAVQDFCEHATEASGIPVILHTFDKSLRFDEVQELSVYRIVQELVHNTLKHAGASEIAITMQHKHKQLQVTYTDNGKGYDPGALLQQGLGLKNIDLRAKLCGGTVAYENKDDGKVEVVVNFPGILTRTHEQH